MPRPDYEVFHVDTGGSWTISWGARVMDGVGGVESGDLGCTDDGTLCALNSWKEWG
jgi:hypothetical protein